ncbi:MAG: glycoside hydrolase family 3 C-terminal domain-containing protein [Planctomycetales bacterium]|nr:glycoside hydrolase family 3 C-terminal domain-containing protein [Planctomycetales bacterium]
MRASASVWLCLVAVVAAPLGVRAEPNPRTVPIAAEDPLYLQVDAPVSARVADLISRMTLEEKALALNHNGPDMERFGLRGDKWNQCLNGVQWNRPTTLFPCCVGMAATWDTRLIQHEVVRAISDEARAIYNLWRKDPAVDAQHKGLIYRDPVINIGRNPYWGRNHEAWGEDPHLTGQMGLAYVRGLHGDDPKHLKLASTLKHYAVNNVETDRFALDAKASRRTLYEYWLPHFRDCVVDGRACSLMASYNAINGTPNNINHWLLTDVLKNEWGHKGFVVSDLGGVRTMVEGHERNQMTYVDAVAQSLMAGCDFSDREFQENIPAAVREGKLTEERLHDALTRVLTVRFRLGEFDPFDAVSYSAISPDVIACQEHRVVARKAARESIVLLQNRDQFLPLEKSKLKRVAVIGPLADVIVLNNYNGVHKEMVTPLAGLRDRLGAGVGVTYARGCGVTRRDGALPTVVDREPGFSQGRSVKLDANSPGGFIDFPLAVEVAGEYELTLGYKGLDSRGTFQPSIDGQPLGDPLDMYAREQTYGLQARLGKLTLPAGQHRLRFTVIGKAEASNGFTGHFDKLTLAGPREQTLELERLRWTTGNLRGADSLEEAVEAASNADVAVVFVGTDRTVEQEGRDRRSLNLPGQQAQLVKAVLEANPRTVVVFKSAGPLTTPWIKQHAPAVLQAWWGGAEGGSAIADVLLGDYNPAGRLPHTVYASERQVPSIDEYEVSAGFTYMYLKGDPQYAFGHGLSYTTFEYDNLHAAPVDGEEPNGFSVSVDVRNTGGRAGDEVVQLYTRAVDSQVPRPKRQLMGFRRVHLGAGEAQTVRFDLPAERLAYYDEQQPGFVVEPGQYEVQIGAASDDIRLRERISVGAQR